MPLNPQQRAALAKANKVRRQQQEEAAAQEQVLKICRHLDAELALKYPDLTSQHAFVAYMTCALAIARDLKVTRKQVLRVVRDMYEANVHGR